MSEPSGTAVSPGTCLIHGYHGMYVCPRCSTSVPVPVQPSEPPPYVDHMALQTGAWQRIAAALERIAEALNPGDADA